MAMKGLASHSGHIFVLARRCYDRIGAQRTESQIVVILAVVALEGFINELEVHAHLASQGGSSVVAHTLSRALRVAEEERASTLLKINVAHLAMTGEFPDKGAQPYQDIELLFRLRNLLVHARPESVEFGEPGKEAEHPKIVRSFVSRGVIPAPNAGAVIAWQEYVIVPGVAAWAYNTAVRAVIWITGGAKEPRLRTLLEFHTNDIAEIDASRPAV
jgi:hypothetical protein